MSPLIREYAVLAPFNPVEYVWIDFASGPVPTDESARAFGDRLRSLPYGEFATQVDDWPFPFEKMALLLPIMIPDQPGERKGAMVVTLERADGEMTFQLWTNSDTHQGSVVIQVTGTLRDHKSTHVSPSYAHAVGQTMQEAAASAYGFLLISLRRLIGLAVLGDPDVTVARPSGNAAVNAKRIKKGKRPFFEWTTIEIKPSAPVEPQGGTHASPKPHMRRGHVRKLKSGKIVTIKSMIINRHKMPDEGFVFHDYKA